jgi:hypothetical protein
LFVLTQARATDDNGDSMQVRFAAIADYALAASDGKLGILGIFDEINPPVLPFAMPQMFLVVSLQGEASESGRPFNLELLLWDADGNQLFANEQPFMFPPPNHPGGRVGHNAVMGLAGLPLQRSGDYSFIIRVNGEERTRVTLRVNEPPRGGQ